MSLVENKLFDYQDLTPDKVAFILHEYRVIDVREPEEFGGPTGHLKCAESIPMATIPRKLWYWDRALPLLVICQSGKRSEYVCKQLVTAGFTKISNLKGGMLAWNEACGFAPKSSVEVLR
jgi:rhodanese-related sulfurtransferase